MQPGFLPLSQHQICHRQRRYRLSMTMPVCVTVTGTTIVCDAALANVAAQTAAETPVTRNVALGPCALCVASTAMPAHVSDSEKLPL